MGVRAGVSDLFLSVARRGYHGLYIEMKYGDNSMSKDQIEFANEVRNENYFVAENVNSFEEFCRVIKWYLSGEKIHAN